MVVGDDHSVDRRDVLDLAGHFGVAFRTEPTEGGAAVCEHWVEEYAQARWEFDVVACMAEPGCPQGRWLRRARGEKGRCVDGDGGGSGVGVVRSARESAQKHAADDGGDGVHFP